jgi:hypothetical protein
MCAERHKPSYATGMIEHQPTITSMIMDWLRAQKLNIVLWSPDLEVNSNL